VLGGKSVTAKRPIFCTLASRGVVLPLPSIGVGPCMLLSRGVFMPLLYSLGVVLNSPRGLSLASLPSAILLEVDTIEVRRSTLSKGVLETLRSFDVGSTSCD